MIGAIRENATSAVGNRHGNMDDPAVGLGSLV